MGGGGGGGGAIINKGGEIKRIIICILFEQ